MKQIGLIGGMSWESSAVYYSIINKLVSEKLGGLHSARIIMDSVDYDHFTSLQHDDNWQQIGADLSEIAQKLEHYGASCVAISCNTMHHVSQDVVKNLNIPFVHIAEVAAKAVEKAKLNKVLLLGTKFTMEKDLFTDELSKYQIEAEIPNEVDRLYVHNAIYNEFCKGIFKDETKTEILKIIAKHQDVQGVILGCTELPMLIKPEDLDIPSFDTTYLHCEALVEIALG